MQWPKEPKNINEEFEQNIKKMSEPLVCEKFKASNDDVIEVTRKYLESSDGKKA